MAEKPLSPFWVYRWAYTMTLSILHRVSGVALIAALLGLVVWLTSVSFGAASYASMLPVLTGSTAKVVMSLAVIALIYHFCNGLRHLAWDLGWGFGLTHVYRSGWAVIVITTGLTVLTFWWMVYP